MTNLRLGLANLRFPRSRDDAVELVRESVREASRRGVELVCFPECFVPGYRGLGTEVAPPDANYLEQAWSSIAEVAREAKLMVVLGTERVRPEGLVPSVLVIDATGARVGFQDKVQIDPSEDGVYTPGDHATRLSLR